MIIFLISSISMSLLALVYMLVMPFLEKRYCAKWRYYAWLVIIIGLLIPFRPQFDFALFRLDGQNNMPSVAFANAEAPSNLFPPINLANFDFEPFDIAQTSNFSLWQIVVMVWLLGAVIFMACQGIKHYRFIKTTRRWSKSLKDEHTLSLLEQIKAEMRIKKHIPLYLCECIGSPILIGLIKPRILLPATKLSQKELCFILKHELVHYKRKDLAYKLLVLFATALHWFNPIVYLIARSISNLCESSCDAEVVRSMDIDMRQSYSKTIITVAKQQSKLKTALSTNFFGGKKNMKNRICHIMDTKKKKMGVIIAGLLLLITISTGVVFAGATGENVATADALAVLEQFGVTFDGFEPFYDGGVVASERQNVYYLGQLARLFSDPSSGTWITSQTQGGLFDIHVIRNEANDITGVDITPSYSFAPTGQVGNIMRPFADGGERLFREVGITEIHGITTNGANIYYHDELVQKIVFYWDYERSWIVFWSEDNEKSDLTIYARLAYGSVTSVSLYSNWVEDWIALRMSENYAFADGRSDADEFMVSRHQWVEEMREIRSIFGSYEQLLAGIENFGITFSNENFISNLDSYRNGYGNIYYQGQLVSSLIDENFYHNNEPHTISFISENAAAGRINVYILRNENGDIIGLNVVER